LDAHGDGAMFGSRLAGGARPRLRPRPRPSAPRPHPSARRSFANQGFDYSRNPVPVFGPVVWAVTAVGTIYFTCAAFDVWQDVKRFDKEHRRSLTFDQLETEHKQRWRRKSLSPSILSPGPIVAGSPSSVWDNLSGPTKIMAGMTLLNAGVFGLSRTPSATALEWWAKLGHIPASPWYRNSQLFTSMFAVTESPNLIALWRFASVSQHYRPSQHRFAHGCETTNFRIRQPLSRLLSLGWCSLLPRRPGLVTFLQAGKTQFRHRRLRSGPGRVRCVGRGGPGRQGQDIPLSYVVPCKDPAGVGDSFRGPWRAGRLASDPLTNSLRP
ncbi:hypothetical protein diail_2457, partial [Diaporthe ilicicola]